MQVSVEGSRELPELEVQARHEDEEQRTQLAPNSAEQLRQPPAPDPWTIQE